MSDTKEYFVQLSLLLPYTPALSIKDVDASIYVELQSAEDSKRTDADVTICLRENVGDASSI